MPESRPESGPESGPEFAAPPVVRPAPAAADRYFASPGDHERRPRVLPGGRRYQWLARSGILVSRPREAALLRRITCITAVLAAGVLVAGCAGGGFHYVKSSEDKTYFKVPDRWTLFDEKDVIDGIGAGLTKSERQTELDQTWRTAFDAAPKPSLEHLGAAGADHPSGLAVVRNLSFDASDVMSNSTLRNYFFDIDTALQAQTGELASYEELQLDGGFRGIRLVASLDVDGKRMTIGQTALVDQATSKIYALLVSCSTACFEANRDQIDKVVDSWTVRDK